MARLSRFFVGVVQELGLLTIWEAPRDTKLLCLQRFVRLFAYGGSTLILALYLSALDVSRSKIGLFMTLTLWGDVVISFFLTLFADRLGRKAVLAVGAVMMMGSGVVFALSANYWILLAAAIFGVISPSGNEIGPFRAVEESTLAHLTPKEVRADVFAWYMLFGTGGAALGLLTCGWVVGYLKMLDGWDDIQAYRVVFFAYAGIGLIKFLLCLTLSKRIEADPEPARTTDDETPLLGDDSRTPPAQKRFWSRLFPRISHESQLILTQLCLLFALDSFASGLASLSWITYFFKIKFDIEDGFLGSLFFVTNIIAALSALVAASLARRIGNINTMVYTHLPSAISLALIPIPSQVWLAAVLLILRSCTQSMDAAPRSAFLAAVVLPNERTAVMGIINLVKTLSQSLGPGIAGVLFDKELYWIAFVMAGSLKAAYDLGMLAVFKGHATREEKADAALEQEEERMQRNREQEDDSDVNNEAGRLLNDTGGVAS